MIDAMEPKRLKLWLDDEREPPAGWIHARSVRQAMLILRTGQVQSLSLDHDLGAGASGYDVVRWIEERCALGAIKPPERIAVHSANPVGRERIRRAVVSIEKLSKNVQAERTRAYRLAQLPVGLVEALVAAMQAACGENLDAIVLYGSYAYGEPSSESDVDICVALKSNPQSEWELDKTIRRLIPDTVLAGHELGLYVETLEQLRRYEGVRETMQAAILHDGLLLWGSLAGPTTGVAPYTRAEVVSQWLGRGHRGVQRIYKMFTPEDERQFGAVEGEQIYYAAGWAIRAALLAHRVRASDAKLRWVVRNLSELLSLIDTALPDVSETVKNLPWWLDAYRYGHVADHAEVTATTCLNALRAARTVLDVCTASAERALGTVLESDRVELMIEDLQAVLFPISGFACLLEPIEYSEAARAIRLFVAMAAPKANVQGALSAFERHWQRQVEVQVATEAELLSGADTAPAVWDEVVNHPNQRRILTGLDRLLDVIRLTHDKT